MAKKHHPFMWTGVDIETSLAPDQIWLAAAEAISTTKGKIGIAADTPLLRAYDIKGSETMFATASELTFDIQISAENAGRRAVRTHIIRALIKDGTLPFSAKKMLGHKAYTSLGQTLGVRIRQADPTALVTFREGPTPQGFALDSLSKTIPVPPAGV